MAQLDARLCVECDKIHGKIYTLDEPIDPRPKLHFNCRCKIEYLRAIAAGLATEQGVNGADWWLKNRGELPEYYISESEAKQAGWKPPEGNLHVAVPGKMIAKGIYRNKDGHLPSAPGRVWYEADINYSSGWRNKQRVLYSNDGLIFVTYDHYKTFYEII